MADGSFTIRGMDAKTARTLNMRLLVAQAGGPTEWAKKYSPLKNDGTARWGQPQANQWISEKNPKPIGHALARDLERAMGLEAGSLDRAPAESQPVQFDRDTLALTLQMVAAQPLTAEQRTDSHHVADLIIKTYCRLVESRHMGSVSGLITGIADAGEV